VKDNNGTFVKIIEEVVVLNKKMNNDEQQHFFPAKKNIFRPLLWNGTSQLRKTRGENRHSLLCHLFFVEKKTMVILICLGENK